MSKVLVTESHLEDIADSIRNKLGVEDTFTPGEMAEAIDDISTGTDTSDATATADDILNPETAYINGKKITGRITVDAVSTEAEVGYAKMDKPNVTILDYNDDLHIALVHDTTSFLVYEWDGELGNLILTKPISSVSGFGTYLTSGSISKTAQTDGTISIWIQTRTSASAWGYSTRTNTSRICVFSYDPTTKQITKNSNILSYTCPDNYGDRHSVFSNIALRADNVAVTGMCSSLTVTSRIIRFNVDTNTISVINSYSFGTTLYGMGWYRYEWNDTGTAFLLTIYNSTENNLQGYAYYYTNNGTDFTLSGNKTNNTATNIKTLYKNYLLDGTSLISKPSGTTVKTYTEYSINSTSLMWTYGDYLFVISTADNTFKCFKINLDLSLTLQFSDSVTLTGLSTAIPGSVSNPISNHFLYTAINTTLYRVKFVDSIKTIKRLIKDQISYYNTNDTTALAENVLYNKIAYNKTGKITGTMPNNGALSYTPSTSSQTIPAGYTSGGTVGAVTLQDKSLTITQNGTQSITPDTGYTGLGSVAITTNVSGGGGPSNIYKFSSLAEAQAKNDYNVGDIAVVMGEERVPFYPQRWNASTSVNTTLRMYVNETVQFTETPTMDVSASWTETSGSKTNTYTISINITSDTITVQLPIYITSVTNCKFVWTSANGTTYNYSYGSYNSTSTNGEDRIVTLINNTTLTNFINALKENWNILNILGKLFSYVGNDIVKNYYRYDGYTLNISKTSFYPYNLSTLVLDSNNQPIDMLPMDTLYTIDTTWFTNYTFGSGTTYHSIVDVGTSLYATTGRIYYVYDAVNNRYIITTTASSVSMINKSTKAVTSVDISSTQISVVNSAGTAQNMYILLSTIPSSCIMYNITYGQTNADIVSIRGPLVTTYINNNSNNLSNTAPYFTAINNEITYNLFYYSCKSLGLKEIKKPDVDMCLILANSILGVS